jgi:hypothetical protein
MLPIDVYLLPGGSSRQLAGTSADPDPPPELTDGRKTSRFPITNPLRAKPEDFQQLDQILQRFALACGSEICYDHDRNRRSYGLPTLAPGAE